MGQFSCLHAGEWEQETAAIEEISNQWNWQDLNSLLRLLCGDVLGSDQGGWWEIGMLFIIIRHCHTPGAGQRISALSKHYRYLLSHNPFFSGNHAVVSIDLSIKTASPQRMRSFSALQLEEEKGRNPELSGPTWLENTNPCQPRVTYGYM